MTGPLTRRVAQLAWIIPLFFVGVSAHQAYVAFDLREMKTQGVEATATVEEVHVDTRTDVTYDYIHIRVPMPDGSVITKEKLSLPHGIAPALEDKETLQVRVTEGANPKVVVTEKIGSTPVVDTQMRIAGINALMSFGAALLFGVGIWFWNRSLLRDGDPAERGISEPDPDHPARQIVRT